MPSWQFASCHAFRPSRLCREGVARLGERINSTFAPRCSHIYGRTRSAPVTALSAVSVRLRLFRPHPAAARLLSPAARFQLAVAPYASDTATSHVHQGISILWRPTEACRSTYRVVSPPRTLRPCAIVRMSCQHVCYVGFRNKQRVSDKGQNTYLDTPCSPDASISYSRHSSSSVCMRTQTR